MDPALLPYLRWLPVVLLACIILAVAKFSPRPAVTLRRGGTMVLILALFMALLPHISLDVFRFTPLVLIGVGTIIGFVRFYNSTPMQRKFGPLAPILAAHRSGDHEAVLRLCDDPALQRHPGVDVDLLRGGSLYGLRRLNEAESCLRRSLTRRHRPVMEALILDQLGQVLLEQGRSGEALGSFQRSGQLDPKRGAAFQNEAEVYLRRKYQLPKALELAQHAVDLDRKQSAELQAVSLSTSLATLAWALAANGRADEARETVREALDKSNPDSLPGRAEDDYLAGRAMLALGDRAAAFEYFRKVSELDPKGNFGFLARQELGASV